MFDPYTRDAAIEIGGEIVGFIVNFLMPFLAGVAVSLAGVVVVLQMIDGTVPVHYWNLLFVLASVPGGIRLCQYVYFHAKEFYS